MPDARFTKNGDVIAAAGLGGVFLVLYGLTLCRTVFWYDSAEFVTAAATLGITHPPGYPVYTLLGHAFTWLPLEPATAVNLMSAAFASLAVALVFGVGRRLGLDRGPAAVGASLLGASGLFWSNAVVAEVYCPAVATAALVLYLLLRALEEHRSSMVLVAAFVAGVGLGVHMSIATLGLGFAWLVWINGKQVKRMLAAAGAALLGSLVFLYVPFRAAQDPALNICNPSSPGQFAWYLTGGAYRHWFEQESGFLGRAASIGGFFPEQLSWVGIALAALGMAWLARNRIDAFLALVLMAAGNLAFFFNYQAHDVEVFLLQTTMVLCCFVAAGTQALTAQIANAVSPDRATQAKRLVAGILMLFPLQLAYTNYDSVDMSHFDETEPFIRAAVDALPQDAVILNFTTPAEWKRHAVFGMYAQLVLGERPDVTHVMSPDLRTLARTFDPNTPMYLYAPIDMMAYFFEITPEGPFLRVVAPKPIAVTSAPRARKKGNRTCWEP